MSVSRSRARLGFGLLASLALLAPGAVASAQEAEDVFLDLRYEGVVDTIVIGRFASDSIYLPVTEIFGVLGIASAYRESTGASGFFVREERPWTIDPSAGAATLDDARVALLPHEYLAEELELFVLPSVLERVFGLRFTIEMATLTLGLQSREPLPVLEAARRAALRSMRGEEAPEAAPGTTFGGDQRVVDFGLLQYGVRATTAHGGSDLAWDLGLGAQLFGGDLQASAVGSLIEGDFTSMSEEVRWRQVFSGRRRLATQLDVGDLYHPGSAPASFVGVRLTNEPIEPRDVSGRHVIEGLAGPGWEVELYRDTDLIAYVRADANGRYRFTVPLAYGTTSLRVREYGPAGQERIRERRVQIPFTFLPPGQMDYQLAAGRVSGSDTQLFAGSLARGITDRVTARAGLDWRRDGSGDAPVPLVGVAARLGRSHLFETEVAPGAFWRATVDLFPSVEANVGLNYVRFAGEGLHNPAQRVDELNLHGYFPVPLGPATNVRVAAGMVGSLVTQRAGWLDVQGSAGAGPVRAVLGYRRSVEMPESGPWFVSHSDVQLGATWGVTRLPAALRSLRGVLVDGLMTWDATRQTLRTMRLGVSASFRTDSHVDLSLNHDLEVGQTNAELRVALRPSFLSAATTLFRAEGGSGVAQEVRGVVAYDSDLGRVVATGREWLGRGGMTVRMFVDEDHDGAYDDGERLLPASGIKFHQPVRIESDGDLLRVHDLLAYHRYRAAVDVAQLPDPTLVPEFTDFAFVADPNVYRTVDIPFQEAGVVDGVVLRRASVGYEGVEGLRVHLEPVGGVGGGLTLRTFSDGGFYAFGLIPGRYRITLDSAQLVALDVRPEPIAQELEIVSLSDGSATEVRFALEPAAASARAELVAAALGERDDAGMIVELRRAATQADERGDVELAIELNHRMLRIRPEDPATYEELARLYLVAGDLQRARDAYRRVLDLASDIPGAHKDLGLVLLAMGDRVEARVVLTTALSENPGDVAVRAALDSLQEE